MELISWNDFEKVNMVVGTILSAKLNEKAKKPSYQLEIDCGEFGIKRSSAQITQNYSLDDLPGKQVVVVINFPAKNIAGVVSEVLVLAAVDQTKGVVLISPLSAVSNGTKIS
jgi:tRNA-binding protein